MFPHQGMVMSVVPALLSIGAVLLYSAGFASLVGALAVLPIRKVR